MTVKDAVIEAHKRMGMTPEESRVALKQANEKHPAGIRFSKKAINSIEKEALVAYFIKLWEEEEKRAIQNN